MKIKENLALIAALAVPVVMIVLVALTIYVPRTWAKPQYDFIYTTEYNYYYRFSVIDGKLNVTESFDPSAPQAAPYPYPAPVPGKDLPPQPKPKIYLHHTDTDSNEEITLEKAQVLNLSGDTKSPDGYQVNRGDSSGSFFGSSGYNTFYITGHHLSQKVNLATSDYGYDFHLIGWIKK